jgi:hypothetical protein
MTPYLPTPTQLGICESEAGNRAKSEVASHTAANGDSRTVKTEPTKVTQFETDAPAREPELVQELYPADNSDFERHGYGVWTVKLAPPNRDKYLLEGTNKNESEVCGRSNPR